VVCRTSSTGRCASAAIKGRSASSQLCLRPIASFATATSRCHQRHRRCIQNPRHRDVRRVARQQAGIRMALQSR
jgi:hypothetical protein